MSTKIKGEFRLRCPAIYNSNHPMLVIEIIRTERGLTLDQVLRLVAAWDNDVEYDKLPVEIIEYAAKESCRVKY